MNLGKQVRYYLSRTIGLAADVSGLATLFGRLNNLIEQALHTQKKVRGIWDVDGTNGNDGNAGNRPEEAFQTIGAAVTAAAAGDLIRISEDTYDEAVSIPAGLVGLEVLCEPGVVITNTTPGDCVTIAAPDVRWIGGRFSQAGQIGLALTGANFYGQGIVASACGAGYSLAGAGSRLLRCNALLCTASGFDVIQANIRLEKCWALGSGAARGFYLGNANADNCTLFDCHSLNCTANGFEIIVGADANTIVNCSQSSLCGGPADGGANNSWINWAIESQIVAGQSIQEDLEDLNDALTTLTTRLSAVRAGYLDELDFDLQGTLATIASYIDTEITTLLTRLTAQRALNLDWLDLSTFTQEAVAATDVNGVTWKDLLDKSTITKPTKICGFMVTLGGAWAGNPKIRITDGAGNKIFPFQDEYEMTVDFADASQVVFNFPVVVPIADGYKFQFRSTNGADGVGETLALNNLDVIEVG